MKRVLAIVFTGMLLFAPLAYAASAPSPGPVPSAGDGISDGSQWDGTNDMLCEVFPELCMGPGPAPDAGDGVSDGSGFEIPPGTAK